MSVDQRDPGMIAESEKRLRFLDELARAVRSVSEPAALMHTTATMLGLHLNASRCAYAQVDADEDHFEVLGDYTDGVESIVGRYAFSDFGAEVTRLMRADQPYVNPDVDAHPVTANSDLSAYRLTRIQAVICVPLLKNGRLVAAMGVNQKTPRAWTPGEIQLVREVVARGWETLDRIRGETALREAHRRLSLAMWAGELGDWSWDAATDVIVLSDRAADIYGVERGKTYLREWLRGLLHPDDCDVARKSAQAAVGKDATYSIQYRVRADGGWRWAFVQGRGTYGADGSCVGMTGIVQDITGLKQAQEAERLASREAERANAIKEEFLATLSHELRTPLSAILGWAHILKNKIAPSETDLQKGIEVIERNTRAQTKLIDDLLDMSRITSGKLRLDVQPVSPVTFIQAAVEAVRPAADSAGVKLETSLDPEAGPVSGDPARLEQVLANLLSNAVKFTPSGGRVQVRVERAEGWAKITITDTGAGIEPEFLPHIFERFRQADGSITRRYGGLGLGLSIVKHLVDLHGGSVHASSPGKGKGASFVVSLPVSAGRADDSGHPSGLRTNALFDPQELQGIKALVVDDEEDSREVLMQVLQAAGAQVLVAENAVLALQMVLEHRPDVLVSDIGMPGVDGYELLRRIRALGEEQGGALPAIALTAFARSEDRVRALRAGFSVHLSKPSEPSEIVAVVASVVR